MTSGMHKMLVDRIKAPNVARTSQRVVAIVEFVLAPAVALGIPGHRQAFILGGTLGTLLAVLVGAVLGAVIYVNACAQPHSPLALWLLSAVLLLIGAGTAFTDLGGLALLWSAVMLLGAFTSSWRWAQETGNKALTVSWIFALAALLAFYADGVAPVVGIRGPSLPATATDALALLPAMAWLSAATFTILWIRGRRPTLHQADDHLPGL